MEVAIMSQAYTILLNYNAKIVLLLEKKEKRKIYGQTY